MNKIQKRLDLAVAVLTGVYISLEIINVALDLLSKVVNYGRTVRKLPIFLYAQREADLRAQSVFGEAWI
ncbi:hypothetical protein [Rhizobium wenxiniae]|uniref:hypothetical protein n=1 Tax=Rhizobium wenxiniae TaxID=1737357 RepID=UPI001C6E6DB6|nr:hypothetical protein [Rhizobium wenxiniae]